MTTRRGATGIQLIARPFQSETTIQWVVKTKPVNGMVRVVVTYALALKKPNVQLHPEANRALKVDAQAISSEGNHN